MISNIPARFIFDTKYLLTLKHIISFPFAVFFAIGFIKYGWRWMFNIFDIMEEKALSPKDSNYKNAVIKAQQDLDMFLSYLIKDVFDCRVLLPVKPKDKKRSWFEAKYLDNKNIRVISNPSLIKKIGRKPVQDVVHINKIEDWSVQKEDFILGLYTVRALADKAVQEGYRLNQKSSLILRKIIN